MMKIAHEHEEVANFMADMFECESGGLYRGRDGREPLEITLRLSLPVRKMLSLGLSNDDGEVSPAILDNGFIPLHDRFCRVKSQVDLHDIHRCLEILSAHVRPPNSEATAVAVQGVTEIFNGLVQELTRFPQHPRLFRFGQVFSTKGTMSLIVQAAERVGVTDASDQELIDKLRSSYEWRGEYAPEGFSQEQSRDFLTTKVTGENVDLIEAACVPTANYWQPPRISLQDVRRAFDWATELALEHAENSSSQEPIVFLCHAVQEVASKLSMMTGDGYELLPGTRLFSHPGKAISRVMIEHALLTSSPEERLETARIGAILLAIGGSVLTVPEVRALGVEADGNTYGMSFDRQIQSGLRILRLIGQLARGEESLAEVLDVYGTQSLTLPGAYYGLIDACGEVWRNREMLQIQLWEEDKRRSPQFQTMKNLLVKIITNGRAELDSSGSVSWWTDNAFPVVDWGSLAEG